MAKKETLVQKATRWQVIIGIQVIASLILAGLVFKLGALPMKYTIVLLAIVALLCVCTFFLMKPSSKRGKGHIRNIIGKIISALLSVFMLVGSLYIAKGNSTIDSITGADTETTRISLVVLKDSSYEKASDLKGKTIALNSNVEETKMKNAVSELKKQVSSFKTEEMSDYQQMANDLYTKKVDAIYLNEAYFVMFEESHPNFENETKILYTYEEEEKIENVSEEVGNVTEDPFVVYISGIDTYGKVSTVSRSDVNMIVTVNPKTKQILMTSIPRDCYVTLANKGKKDKLTHSGLAGIQNTIKTMENFMNIKINYYARVNFTSLIKMVDALGGVDVNSIQSFDSQGYHFKKGVNHLNGQQALTFSRDRYHVTGGDNGRVANQQRVLEAMLNKMMSPAIITNYSKVLKAIDGAFETNMKSSDITGLLQMQIDDMAKWTITKKQLTGTGKLMTGGAYMPNNNLYYMIPNQKSVEENRQAIQSVLNGESVQ